MREEKTGSRCLRMIEGILLIASEVVQDSPLKFRSLIAVNTNVYAATIKVGEAREGLSGGWVKTIKLSSVGVASQVRLSVRCATTNFNYEEDIEVQVGLENGRVVYTLSQ